MKSPTAPLPRRCARLLACGVVLCSLLGLAPASQIAAAAAGAAPPQKHVLILNSYDPTYRWTANIVRGVQSVFDRMNDVELSIEYMDSKKAFSSEYAQLLSQIYARKYGSLRFDLIISSDDDALDFLKKYRDDLFPGVPVVFSGVNSFRDERVTGFPNVTGVNEESDFDKNIAWVEHLRPATRRLVFVFDESATSVGSIRRLDVVRPRWAARFQFQIISHVTVAELQAELRRLPADAVVFWGMFMRDRAGVPLSMGESHRIIVDASPVPVFGFTDTSVSQGAVGGYVVSGFSQGETAARMGASVLANGLRASDIPIVRQSPNVYMLDYPAFQRWQLDAENPPPGTVIVDKPFSFYERYRGYVWAALGGMGGESLIILALIAAIRTMTRKSRARLRESEDRYRSIVEDGSELICRIDTAGHVLFINGAFARLLGERPEALVGRPAWELGIADDESLVRTLIAALRPDRPVSSTEQPLVASTGEKHWVLWTYRGMFAADGRLAEVQGVGTDITARRDAELALQSALRKVEVGNVELGYANQNLQGVLDSMREGLVVCDRQGLLTKVHSRAAAEWFGAPVHGATLWDYLFPQPSVEKLWFRTAVEQVAEEMLPFEVAVDQLPKTLERAGNTYSVTCHQVIRDERCVELVFTLADVSQQLKQDRIQQLHRELPFIVGHLLRDREGFQGFVEETEQMLARLTVVTDGDEIRRLLHTLKGTAAIYGFELFAAHCHEMEDLLEAEGAADGARKIGEGVQALAQDWSTALTSFSMFLGAETEASIRLEQSEHAEFLRRLESGEDHTELLRLARRWSDPPLSQVLAIYVRTIRQLATRLGKEIDPQIIDHRVRLPSAEMRPFLGVLVHVVRNSVDHGIELPDERERAGKPRMGRVTIESRFDGDTFVVIVEDDGRGIDWDTIRERARLRSLPATNERELEDALFTDGITTRDAVSDLSGRGVGLSAVRQICQQLGGTIQVDSRRGLGTRFEFRFTSPIAPPSSKQEVQAAAHAA